MFLTLQYSWHLTFYGPYANQLHDSLSALSLSNEEPLFFPNDLTEFGFFALLFDAFLNTQAQCSNRKKNSAKIVEFLDDGNYVFH